MKGDPKDATLAPYGIAEGDCVQLYLKCAVSGGHDNSALHVNVETLAAIYAVRFAGCDDAASVIFVPSEFAKEEHRFQLSPEFVDGCKVLKTGVKSDDLVAACRLPAVQVASRRLCVTGLCAVVRFLIRLKAARSGDGDGGKRLLGYQGTESCLLFAS